MELKEDTSKSQITPLRLRSSRFFTLVFYPAINIHKIYSVSFLVKRNSREIHRGSERLRSVLRAESRLTKTSTQRIQNRGFPPTGVCSGTWVAR